MRDFGCWLPGGQKFTMTEGFTGPLAGLVTKAIPDLTAATLVSSGMAVLHAKSRPG